MPNPAKVMRGNADAGIPVGNVIMSAQELAHQLGTGLAIQVGQPAGFGAQPSRAQLPEIGLHALADAWTTTWSRRSEHWRSCSPLIGRSRRRVRLYTSGVAGGERDGYQRQAEWPETCPAGIFPVTAHRIGFHARSNAPPSSVSAFLGSAGRRETTGVSIDEDVWFCHRVRQTGLPIFCDGSLVRRHVKMQFRPRSRLAAAPCKEAATPLISGADWRPQVFTYRSFASGCTPPI